MHRDNTGSAAIWDLGISDMSTRYLADDASHAILAASAASLYVPKVSMTTTYGCYSCCPH